MISNSWRRDTPPKVQTPIFDITFSSPCSSAAR